MVIKDQYRTGVTHVTSDPSGAQKESDWVARITTSDGSYVPEDVILTILARYTHLGARIPGSEERGDDDEIPQRSVIEVALPRLPEDESSDEVQTTQEDLRRIVEDEGLSVEFDDFSGFFG